MGRARKDEMMVQERQVLQKGTRRTIEAEPRLKGSLGAGLLDKAREALSGRNRQIDRAIEESGG